MKLRHFAVLAAALALQACGSRPQKVDFQPLSLPELDLTVLPESERSLRRIVLGLDLNTTKLYMIPSTQEFDLKSMDPRVRFLRRRLYWLTFELLHGQIFKFAPPHSKFFISVPDPKLHPQSLGREEEILKEYLSERVGWNAEQIAARVKFFKIAGVNLFPQDAAEVLGRDSKGRIVLGQGGDKQWNQYSDALEKMVAAFPDDFSLRKLGEINTEGGDLELVWTPEGRVAVLVGNHRIRRYVNHRYGVDMTGKSMDQKLIDEAKQDFSKAFFNLEVMVLGEDGLRNPLLISEELFHADMVANIIRNQDEALAFVPTFAEEKNGGTTDALTRQVLAPELARRVQAVYDRAARQLGKRGYKVARLPFSDHPARNPVNVAKFIHPVTGKNTVLLGKYPYHYPLSPGQTPPQQAIQLALDDLHLRVSDWHQDSSEARWKELTASIGRLWSAMDQATEAAHPEFESQMHAYEKSGVSIMPLPIFPTGEGGLHCLLLN